MSEPQAKTLRIGIVAGEASGDLLGAGLIKALKTHFPDAIFEGIGGPKMLAEGFNSQVAMERLSVMGLVEVLGRLFELLGIRRRLVNHFSDYPPAVFIGIDAPDFNLPIEKKLKQQGIKTVQYVSPQFWAWRQGRAKKMPATVDMILALFPFEMDFYRQYPLQVAFVGHPLADDLPLTTCREAARQSLDMDADVIDKKQLALLPGSRMSELKRLLPLFLDTASVCMMSEPELVLSIAAIHHDAAEYIKQYLVDTEYPHAVDIYIGQAREVMGAADVLLVASGTVTLEAALIKRPMVVAYKMASLSYRIAQKLVKTEHIALPNLLAKQRLIPEFVQDQAEPVAIADALLAYLHQPETAVALVDAFTDIHQQLKQDASQQAANAIAKLIAEAADA